jgi:hypothetical protein
LKTGRIHQHKKEHARERTNEGRNEQINEARKEQKITSPGNHLSEAILNCKRWLRSVLLLEKVKKRCKVLAHTHFSSFKIISRRFYFMCKEDNDQRNSECPKDGKDIEKEGSASLQIGLVSESVRV